MHNWHHFGPNTSRNRQRAIERHITAFNSANRTVLLADVDNHTRSRLSHHTRLTDKIDSCLFPEKLEPESTWTSSYNKSERPNFVRFSPPAFPTTRKILESTSKGLAAPKPGTLRQHKSFLFPIVQLKTEYRLACPQEYPVLQSWALTFQRNFYNIALRSSQHTNLVSHMEQPTFICTANFLLQELSWT